MTKVKPLPAYVVDYHQAKARQAYFAAQQEGILRRERQRVKQRRDWRQVKERPDGRRNMRAAKAAEFDEGLAARGKTPKSRNALIKLGLQARSASEIAKGVRGLRAEQHLSGVFLSAQRTFGRACAFYHEADPTIYTLERLISMCIWYVHPDMHACQSSGLSDLISRLKLYCLAMGREWVSAQQADELGSIRRMLEWQFPSVRRSAAALTWSDLDPLLGVLEAKAAVGNVFAAQIGAMVVLAHECMFRGSEFLQKSLLTEDVRCVQPGSDSGHGGVIVVVWVPKTSKDEHDEVNNSRIAVSRPREPLHDAKRWLERYLTLAKPGPKELIFPHRNESGIIVRKKGASVGFSYQEFTRLLREQLREAGVANADLFVARSMRAGGHTDYAAEGVDMPTIGIMGGWKDIRSQARYMRLMKAGLKAMSRGVAA